MSAGLNARHERLFYFHLRTLVDILELCFFGGSGLVNCLVAGRREAGSWEGFCYKCCTFAKYNIELHFGGEIGVECIFMRETLRFNLLSSTFGMFRVCVNDCKI